MDSWEKYRQRRAEERRQAGKPIPPGFFGKGGVNPHEKSDAATEAQAYETAAANLAQEHLTQRLREGTDETWQQYLERQQAAHRDLPQEEKIEWEKKFTALNLARNECFRAFVIPQEVVAALTDRDRERMLISDLVPVGEAKNTLERAFLNLTNDADLARELVESVEDYCRRHGQEAVNEARPKTAAARREPPTSSWPHR